MTIDGPGDREFLTYVELSRRLDEKQHEAERQRQNAEAERKRAERLAARLQEQGLEPDE